MPFFPNELLRRARKRADPGLHGWRCDQTGLLFTFRLDQKAPFSKHTKKKCLKRSGAAADEGVTKERSEGEGRSRRSDGLEEPVNVSDRQVFGRSALSL